MSQIVLAEIEQKIFNLPVNEQLLLISRVAEKLRTKIDKNAPNFQESLAEMANDADIRGEIKKIERDFLHTELDGLAK